MYNYVTDEARQTREGVVRMRQEEHDEWVATRDARAGFEEVMILQRQEQFLALDRMGVVDHAFRAGINRSKALWR